MSPYPELQELSGTNTGPAGLVGPTHGRGCRLSSGVHVVEVQAMGVVDATATNGSSEAKAYAGAGSVTIEEVR